MTSRLALLFLGAAFAAALLEFLIASAPSGAGRKLQAALFEMGVFHLLLSRVLTRRESPAWAMLGSGLYAAGAALIPFAPSASILVPVGAGVLLVGLLELLARDSSHLGSVPDARLVVAIAAAGTLLIGFLGMEAWGSSLPVWWQLGFEDGVRLRMLRLARVAAFALPLLLLLYHELRAARPPVPERVFNVGRRALQVGAATMAPVLAAAALTWTGFKYLLPVPADAALIGSGIAAWIAWRSAPRRVAAGWLLVVSSMTVGLLLGGFAFDGPLPAPSHFAAYEDPLRWWVRQAHTYAILLGLALLASGPRRAGGPEPAEGEPGL